MESEDSTSVHSLILIIVLCLCGDVLIYRKYHQKYVVAGGTSGWGPDSQVTRKNSLLIPVFKVFVFKLLLFKNAHLYSNQKCKLKKG